MEKTEKETFENIQILAVRRACAHLSEEEILEAENLFKEYISLVIEINENYKYRQSLTKLPPRTSVKE